MSTLTLNTKDDSRDSLYYGQFLYSARFHFREATVFRRLDHLYITSTLDTRSKWNWKTITDETYNNAHEICDALLKIKNPHKITIYADWLYFYTNDLEDVAQLCQTSLMFCGPLHRARVTHAKGTIGQLDPKYKYRTYIRSHKPTQEQIESLRQLVENSGPDVKMSPGLRNWLKQNRYVWTWDHHYVDHNDMKVATMLALINPKFVRETKPIVRINK